MLFLLEYNREKGLIVKLTQFSDAESLIASQTRLELEISLNSRGVHHEVVLLDAATEDDLRRTHRRYFADISELTNAESAD